MRMRAWIRDRRSGVAPDVPALRLVAACALVAALALAPAWGPTADAATGPGATAAARTLGPGGWSWFGDPRAVYHAGKHRRTYTGWIDRAGNVVVASIDHDSGAIARATLHKGLGVDDHNNPSLLVRPDGRIEAFYSAHNGPVMYSRRTKRPEDVTVWEAERRLSTNLPGRFGVTYPSPVRLADERRDYLFWRGGDWSPAFATRDDGRDWSKAKRLLTPPGGRKKGKTARRPYLKVATNNRDTIAIALTADHPHAYNTGIRFVMYRDGALRRADGSVITSMRGLPLGARRTEVVYAAGRYKPKAWLGDVALDAEGRPVIVFVVLHGLRDHRYRYARWTGERWTTHDIARAGNTINAVDAFKAPPDPAKMSYTPGVVLDHTDPSVVYLSRLVGKTHEIERWETPDDGATWTSRKITSNSKVPNMRPVSPRNHPPGELEVLWMRGRYGGYLRYLTDVVAP
jgi:hypothetical protein